MPISRDLLGGKASHPETVTKEPDVTVQEVSAKKEPVYSIFSGSVQHGAPIKEHPLEKADESFKSLYYDFLYLTAQFDSTDTDDKISFIKRIMDGTNAVTLISDHIKECSSLSAESAASFTKSCIQYKLQYTFFTDCLLIACSGGSITQKQAGYLTEAAAALSLEKEEVRILCGYASAILEQNTDKYEAANKKDTFGLYRHILCYTKKFICGALADTANCLHLFSLAHEKIDPKKILSVSESSTYNSCEISRENIIFENLIIDMGTMTQIHDFHIGFNCAKKIVFQNCDFLNCGSLRFHGCYDIEAINCSFVNFDNDAVFDLNPDCRLSLEECSLKNCGYESVFANAIGGVIKSTNLNRISFKKCTFNGCFIKGSFKGGIISFNNIVEAENCKFNGCNSGAYLFFSNNGSFKGSGNIATDSAELRT